MYEQNTGGHLEFTELQAQLLNKQIVDIVGEVNEEMSMYVRHVLSWLQASDNPDITVQITSPGGSAHHGLAIYDMLRLYRGKTTGTALEQSSSAAAIILQACTQRQASSNSRLLIHFPADPHVTLDQLTSKKKFNELKKGMWEVQHAMEEIVILRTGKKLTEVRREFRKNEFMTAKEALKFGLIDVIV